jgi:hypothetical protein
MKKGTAVLLSLTYRHRARVEVANNNIIPTFSVPVAHVEWALVVAQFFAVVV